MFDTLRHTRPLLLLPCALLFAGCSDSDDGKSDGDGAEQTEETTPGTEAQDTFVRGCDPSWVTEMESKDVRFYTRSGKEADCFAILQGVGFNAARLRVWVNPAAPWCAQDDVINKALRAQELGMDIMIDFHYSDTWADPEKKYRPASWDSYARLDELAAAVSNHTTAVLTALKQSKVNVRWVQIGNETHNGMLGTLSDGTATQVNGLIYKSKGNETGADYAKLHNAGATAAKAVFPDAQVVVHFENGQKLGDLQWGLDMLTKAGGKFDILGVSLYNGDDDPNWGKWESDVKTTLANLTTISKKYDCDVMVCEVGCPNIESAAMGQCLSALVTGCRGIQRCQGVFYWEPEAHNDWNGYKKGGFTKTGRPAAALDAFKPL